MLSWRRASRGSASIVPLPVTLAYFHAAGDASRIRFSWTTATETGHAGFYLYAADGDKWRLLTWRLIRSRVVDSVDPQRYAYEVSGVTATASKS